jgi:ethanolamine utilization protein EutP (predicted NTPase)
MATAIDMEEQNIFYQNCLLCNRGGYEPLFKVSAYYQNQLTKMLQTLLIHPESAYFPQPSPFLHFDHQ